MKKIVGLLGCSLLAACGGVHKKIIEGPAPGIEYRNQDTAPWPWVSVVPSPRSLALTNINVESLIRQVRYDMSFDAFSKPFEDVRLVLLDYTILPRRLKSRKSGRERPNRYFLTMGFYKLNKRPPCPPDFEITASIHTSRAGAREAMRFMVREILEEVYLLSLGNLLTPGKKVTIDLD